MKNQKVPVNVYGFHSMVLGISLDRFVGIGIFAAASLIAFRFSILISFAILVTGFVTVLFRRDDQYVLTTALRTVSWKFGAKEFSYEPEYRIEHSGDLFILEGKRIGIAMQVLTDEIYDLGEKESGSTIQVLAKALDSTTCDMNIFAFRTDDVIDSHAYDNREQRVKEYASLRQQMQKHSQRYDIFLMLSRQVSSIETDRKRLKKDLDTIVFAISMSGGSVDLHVSKEVIERISSTFL